MKPGAQAVGAGPRFRAMGGDALDRARGALVGLACGDAVGTTLEFRRPGSFEPIVDLVGGGSFGLRAGQWTDDTSMALCLGESIITVGGMDLTDQMRRYVRWRDDGHWSSTGRWPSIEAKRASFPIPDVSVIDVDGYTPIVDLVEAEVAANRPTYVHCWGGIGRTGTVIGCWLVHNGRTADEAVTEIAALRAGSRNERRRSPETDEQIHMIRSWAAL